MKAIALIVVNKGFAYTYAPDHDDDDEDTPNAQDQLRSEAE
jgi:hypothetical protein